MNIGDAWVKLLISEGHDAVHWSSIGASADTDIAIMEFARSDNRIVVTNDLDFGTILATTKAAGPSVIQIRTRNTLASRIGPTVLRALASAREELATGALITIDSDRFRVRSLPITSAY
jgi:predicted nuclease of predicted toxin-antitoxin system